MSAEQIQAQKQALRQQFRTARQQLSLDTQYRHAMSLAKHFSNANLFRDAKSIAMYLANDGELSLSYLMERAFELGKRVYLPKIRDNSMSFHRHHQGASLEKNRYGINEPKIETERCEAMQLDLVLMPLVSFDSDGKRLGMGGGFYDRCFAFRQSRSGKPTLIGVAHEIQRHASLPSETWDLPLDGILTEREYCELKATL
jgi:5-formyltetrahydrofolate cyclo-ligase